MSVLSINGTVSALSLRCPLAKRFAWKANLHSHSPQPLLNCQILLTSLFPVECDCILFLHPPAELPQLANVSNSLRLPASVPCKHGNSSGSTGCRVHILAAWQGLRLPIASRWLSGYWAINVREMGLVLPTTVSSLERERMFPSPSLLRVTASANVSVSSITQSERVSSGEPLALSRWQPALSGDSSDKISSICRAIFCARRGSERPTPPFPCLLLPGASLPKVLPTILPQNNFLCYPDSLGLKAKKISVFKESFLVFPVTCVVTERGYSCGITL